MIGEENRKVAFRWSSSLVCLAALALTPASAMQERDPLAPLPSTPQPQPVPAPVTPRPAPMLQPVGRDFAFLVPAELAAGDLLRAIRGADKGTIVAARVFDVFAGAGVPDGRKSVAIEVTLQPGEKSFTDAEIKAIGDRIVAAAAKLGATLRA